MTNKEFASTIANVHNKLIEINVKGEDVFRMAEVLMTCRNIVERCNEEEAQEQLQEQLVED